MGDDEFEEFVRTHRGSLVRFATTLTGGDDHLAEDLVQGALVRIYLAKPAHLANAYGYARRTVANALIDHARRPFVRRERARSELPDRASDPAVEDVDVELTSALSALPVRMRAAVVLRHVEGLSVEETARALRCSRGNVKSQTARGLEKLRVLLAAPPDLTDPPAFSRADGARKESLPCRTS